MKNNYKCHIFENTKLIRKFYLSTIPRIGESISYYTSKTHSFTTAKVQDVIYVIAPERELIINIYI